MVNKTFLMELLNESGSDKSVSHNYEIAYSQILPDTLNNMLEIGIGCYNNSNDTSLRAWEKLYPNANIYAIDIDETKLINKEKIKSFKVDQFSVSELNNFSKNLDVKFDVIIDDGVHLLSPTIATFEALFPCLNDNGVYCIEDVRKNLPMWAEDHQMVSTISEYLNSRNDVSYEIFDTRPNIDDDSIVFAIRKVKV